ncbi:nitrite/sulfite reductase [Parvularcula sp. IMCC14364]|uniref:nitrite/sulfite reductase n=1 Tax=Parvularcula sp. IMCC14364 TaxID=3067902 RepID=UPI00274155C7|nr:nitrite/sulfite reductase [Parvularcula sp. IMCC14364]
MYRYDEFDTRIVHDRVSQFRGQVQRRLSGDLTEDQFKPLRLMNGVYLQLHAYMLRVAIPYGTLSSDQLRKLAFIADKYDKGFGHITTRQNIQFNWPALVDIPEILDHLADVEMHAIQTSGNCIRNVTTDHFAGATAEEVEDPRVWCEVIRQWSTLHPEFTFLPRKFKIAVTASAQDRAAIRVHDIGLHLVKNLAGETGFEVFVGGGLGRTPYVGDVIRPFLPKDHLLSYLEAILRVYNLQGRRDNMYKARIKILVNALGIEQFRDLVEAEWQNTRKTSVDVPQEEVDRINSYFAAPPFEQLADDMSFAKAQQDDPDFARWVRQNVSAHKQPGYAIATISLKAPEMAPGDITSGQMLLVADLAKAYAFDEIRTTHEQNLVLPHVRQKDLYTVWQQLAKKGLGTANAGLVSDIIACPGLDYCNLANTRSIPIAKRIQERFFAPEKQEEIGELKIKISGCINACGHHHVGHIGILGVDKKGEEFYQITLGGSAAEDASIGEIVGRGLSTDEVVDSIDRLVGYYLKARQSEERFVDTYKRLGSEPFKEALYVA